MMQHFCCPLSREKTHETIKVCSQYFSLTIASEIPSNTPKDYTQFTRNPSFHGLRLGVPRTIFYDKTFLRRSEIIDAANIAIERMKALGAFIQDPADLPSANELPSMYMGPEAIVMRIEFHLIS
jgi:hypothetical protein